MRSPRTVAHALLASLALTCGGEADRAAQDAGAPPVEPAEVGSPAAERALEAWLENAEGVAGYTVVESTNAGEHTRTYEKIVVDGIPVFRPVGAVGERTTTRILRLLPSARPEGTGEVDGVATDVLVVEDTAALRDVIEASGGGPYAPTRLEIEIGPDGFPRRLAMEGTATTPAGATVPVSTTVTMTDWRTVDGFAHPFRTASRVEGLGRLSEAAASSAMEEMERRMEGMSEARRERAREMMRERMASTGEGARESTTVVKELRVERE